MPYTLVIGLMWFGLAFVLGLVVGLVFRSVTARRQIARARVAGGPDPAEVERLRIRVVELEAALRSRTVVPAEAAAPVAVDVEPPLVDDLTVIVGLGPAVAELCEGIGITTWRDLAETEVSLLRTLLDDAGARYRVHDPTSWPTQARMLVEGRWDEFHAHAETIQRDASDGA